jgi:hypothetical protein
MGKRRSAGVVFTLTPKTLKKYVNVMICHDEAVWNKEPLTAMVAASPAA